MHFAIAYTLFVAVCIVLAFQRHPIYALYFYLSTTYVHPPSRWWAVHLPDLRWAVLSAAICVLAVLFHRGRLHQRPSLAISPPAIILCLYGSWMWIQTLWALDVNEHLTGTATFTKYILTLWFVYRIADTKELIRDVMLFHGAGCAMLGVIARYFEFRTGGRVEGVGGPGIDDANSLGMFLCTGVVICLCLFMSQRGWRRWLALGLLTVAFVGFTMTESRGAFVGLIAGVFTFLVASVRTNTKAVLMLGMAALLVGAVAVKRDQRLFDRILTVGDVAADREDEEADASARSRAVIINAQLEMAKDYPLGTGHRGTVVLAPQYIDRGYLVGGGADPDASRSSHNTALSALVEQGIVGAGLYLAMVVCLLVTVGRLVGKRRRGQDAELTVLAAGLCGGLTVVLIAGLATDYLLAEVQFWFIGLLVSALRLSTNPAAAVQPAAAAQHGVPSSALSGHR